MKDTRLDTKGTATRRAASGVGEIRRQAVMEAALGEFSEKGYEGAGMRAIAARAGMEPGHLTYYARSKEALWRSVIQEFDADLNGQLKRLDTENVNNMPASEARIVLESVLQHFARKKRLTRLVMHELSVLSPRNEWIVRAVAEPVRRSLEPLLKSLQRRGLIRGSDPTLAYFGLVGSVILYCGSHPEIRRITARSGTRRADPRALIEYLLDNLFIVRSVQPTKD